MNIKHTFHQSQVHAYFYLFVVALLLLVIVSEQLLSFLLGIPLFIYFFRSYHITEMNTLVGNGTVAIASIEKLVVNGIKVKVYYRSVVTHQLESKMYFLRTPQDFVKALVAINPSIQVSEL